MNATATMPGSPQLRRRWFRYSLRTLMIFVTLAAFACSWFAVKLRDARKQHEAVEAIENTGGHVVYAYQLDTWGRQIPNAQPRPPAWLRKMFGDNLFEDVVGVTAWKDEQLKYIRSFPKLQTLDFYCGIDVTDAGMANLQYVPQLRELRFGDRQDRVTSAGLLYLRFLPRLRRLTIESTPITDADLQYLEGMHELEELSFEGKITDAGLSHLYGLKNLKDVGLDARRITAKGIEDFRAALPNCEIEWLADTIQDSGTIISGSNRSPTDLASDPFRSAATPSEHTAAHPADTAGKKSDDPFGE